MKGKYVELSVVKLIYNMKGNVTDYFLSLNIAS